MEVRLKSGTAHRVSIALPRGEPENPLTAEEVSSKFSSQTNSIIGSEKAGRLLALIQNIESLESVDALMDCTFTPSD